MKLIFILIIVFILGIFMGYLATTQSFNCCVKFCGMCISGEYPILRPLLQKINNIIY